MAPQLFKSENELNDITIINNYLKRRLGMRNVVIASLVLMTCSLAVMASTGTGTTGKIPVGGKDRDYVVHVPTGLPASPALVLALHPLSGNGSMFQSMSGWDAVADKEKFVVVYPTGITMVSMGGSSMPGWDITGQSDINFMMALIDTMAARYKINRKTVFSTGFSMGGMLSYVLACQKSDLIAAIGPDAGYPIGQNASSCKPSRPVSVCHVHGEKDDFVKIADVPPWIKKFVEVDTCQSSPKITNGAKYKKEDYTPCNNGNEVVYYTIAGMSHDYATSSKHGFSATDTFCAFFKRHGMGSSTGVANPISEIRPMQSVFTGYSAGKIHLTVNREINSVGVFDVYGRTIYTWKEPTQQVSNLIVPVGGTSGKICIAKVSGPAGVSMARVLIP
jgi:poly(3-hydroxybutyrate) depolymerase